ncbi:KAP family P-loop NTPase fold protein [Macrococcoides caseolyticum]|uniref:KAP family P-loop NTPase fold protein n=1 Tax=Macrococcoides caseolyticum TaxID=69966 RepID=UPI001F307AAF|nr:P-loop NTPase fold protein [Macrococcus caseolyticus]MCE4956046.1 AAA family ATPase [Macrococcus caseolyticus]
MKFSISADKPLDEIEKDLFNRKVFSNRIADMLKERNEKDCLIIGLYGRWGYGKTTILNFIEKNLESEESIIIYKFNPWRYPDEEILIRNFFIDLGEHLDFSIINKREKIGSLIENSIKPLSKMFNAEKYISGLQVFFKASNLEVLKNNLQKYLQLSKKKILIVIDDIDRLEKNEILSLFRLIKLVSDFENIHFLLAMDKNIVSSVLNQNYMSDEIYGNNFLEKIVNLPIEIPEIREEQLLQFCYTELNRIIQVESLDLTDNEMNEFTYNFSRYLMHFIDSPRQVLRYINNIKFVASFIKGEVDYSDFFLIEGVKVFVPQLYDIYISNKILFYNSNYFNSMDLENKNSQFEAIVTQKMNYLKDFEITKLKKLTYYLFPNLKNDNNNILSNNRINKRVSNPDYFEKYFSYSLLDTEISDNIIAQVFDLLIRYNDDVVLGSYIKEIITPRNKLSFATKLRKSIELLDNTTVPILLKILEKNIIDLKYKNTSLLERNDFTEFAMLSSDLFLKIDDSDIRYKLAEEFISNCKNLIFTAESFNWFRKETAQYPEKNAFTNSELKGLGRILVRRIKKDLINLPYDELFSLKYLSIYFRYWFLYGEKGEFRSYINNILNQNSIYVFDLITLYLPRIVGYEERLTDLDIDHYNLINERFDSDIIIKALIQELGEDISEMEEYPELKDDWHNKIIVGYQYLWFHNKNE